MKITLKELVAIRAELKEAFAKELEGLRLKKLLKPKQIEDLAAGFDDGTRSLGRMLALRGYLEIDEEPTETAAKAVRS